MSDNIDSAVLANMSDRGLSNLIQTSQYQAAVPEAIPAGANLSGSDAPIGLPGVVGASPASGNGMMGMAPQAPDASQVELQRLRQVAWNAANEKIALEEELFNERIQDLPQAERDAAILARQVEQYEKVNGYLNNQIQTRQEAEMTARQESAKRQWGFLIANKYGIPYNNEGVKRVLLSSGNRAEMEAAAAELAQTLGGNRAAFVQNQANGGAFAAGGFRGGAASPQVQERSGDLTGYIGSRGYQVTNY